MSTEIDPKKEDSKLKLILRSLNVPNFQEQTPEVASESERIKNIERDKYQAIWYLVGFITSLLVILFAPWFFKLSVPPAIVKFCSWKIKSKHKADQRSQSRIEDNILRERDKIHHLRFRALSESLLYKQNDLNAEASARQVKLNGLLKSHAKANQNFEEEYNRHDCELNEQLRLEQERIYKSDNDVLKTLDRVSPALPQSAVIVEVIDEKPAQLDPVEKIDHKQEELVTRSADQDSLLVEGTIESEISSPALNQWEDAELPDRRHASQPDQQKLL